MPLPDLVVADMVVVVAGCGSSTHADTVVVAREEIGAVCH